MSSLAVYLPLDRRLSLAMHEAMPDRVVGSALFADISGFTVMTEALVQLYGPQRGAEELPRYLNEVYGVVIAEIERYGGSVIGFSGDGITCWFDGEPAKTAPLAAAAAFGVQRAMQPFAAIQLAAGRTASLAIKVAVASGSARRFAVGDPDIQLMDVLAGALLDRLANAEHLAKQGEVILDQPTYALLENQITVGDWRYGEDSGSSFVVAQSLSAAAAPVPWNFDALPTLPEAELRRWVLPAVYERQRQIDAGYLTELRRVVALFMRFGGIDYDGEHAGREFDTFIQWVQRIVHRYEGALVQLTVGDKGSYLYMVFGAPVAHEDDVRRALQVALELATLPAMLPHMTLPHIGISQGVMRTGQYGGFHRRTYGVLGDEVNVAARLMQMAGPGQIIVSERVKKRAGGEFDFEPLPPVRLKGKSSPVPLFRLLGTTTAADVAQSPLVGREQEWGVLSAAITALQAQAQTSHVIIEGDPGIGKSRLVEEAARLARGNGVRVLYGAGSAIESTAPYHAWREVFARLLHFEATAPEEAQHKALEERLGPALMERAALLNAVLPLQLPDSPFTSALAGQARAHHTRDLLVRLLQDEADRTPVMIILEDAHWLDSASWALAGAVAERVRPLLFVVATRPIVDPMPKEYEQLRNSDPATLLRVEPLTSSEVLALIAHRLGAASLDPRIAALISEKAEGNPFFSEELATALRDAGFIAVVDGECRLAPEADAALLSFPDTVQGIIASRIDQLPPPQQLTLKVASVIGRAFAFTMLHSVHPLQADEQQLEAHLNSLERRELTLTEVPHPNARHAFKHAITQEVTYSLLLFEQRRELHRSIAEWCEQRYADDLPSYYDVLAYHWLHAENDAKAISYLEKAGDAAARIHANPEASLHYGRAIGRLLAHASPDLTTLQRLFLNRGRALEHATRFDEALANYQQMQQVADEHGDQRMALASLTAQATLYCAPTPVHDEAQGQAYSEMALPLARALNDAEAEAKNLWNLLLLYSTNGREELAIEYGERALEVARAFGLRQQLAFVQNDINRIYVGRWEFERALAGVEEARAQWQALDNQPMLADNLARTARILFAMGRYDQALSRADEALTLALRINNLWNQCFARMFTGYIHFDRGDTGMALEVMETCIRLGDQGGMMMASIGARAGLAWVYASMGHTEHGLTLARQACARSERLPLLRAWALAVLTRVLLLRNEREEAEAALAEGQAFLMHADRATHGPLLMPFAEAEMRLAQGDLDRAAAVVTPLVDRLARAGMKSFLADALCLQARITAEGGDMEAAYEQLEQAYSVARELGAARVLWKVTDAMAAIEEARDRAEHARALRAESRRLLSGILARCPEPIEPFFRGLPAVQHALQQA